MKDPQPILSKSGPIRRVTIAASDTYHVERIYGR